MRREAGVSKKRWCANWKLVPVFTGLLIIISSSSVGRSSTLMAFLADIPFKATSPEESMVLQNSGAKRYATNYV